MRRSAADRKAAAAATVVTSIVTGRIVSAADGHRTGRTLRREDALPDHAHSGAVAREPVGGGAWAWEACRH